MLKDNSVEFKRIVILFIVDKSHLFNVVCSPDVDPNEGVAGAPDWLHHCPSTRFHLHIWRGV